MRPRPADLWAHCPFTLALLVINGALFIVTALLSKNVFNIDLSVLLQFGASQREGLWEGEWYRLVAPMFLHGGLIHIFFNMTFLNQEGPATEIYFGTANFGTIYLLSGVMGIVLSQIFGGNVSIGASTSLCGIMGAHLAIAVLRAPVLRHAWRNSEVQGVFWRIAILFLIGLVGRFSSGSFLGRMDNLGHFGGLLGGVSLGGAFELWRNRSRWAAPLMGATLLTIVLLVCAARWSVFNPQYYLFLGSADAAEAKDKTAARPNFERAREVAAKWNNFGWTGVLNAAETGHIIRAFNGGGWKYSSARKWSMELIADFYRRGRSDEIDDESEQ